MVLYSGYWPDWSILAVCQLSRDVIGYEHSSDYFWNDSCLGSNLSQLYLAACENSTVNTFKTLQVSSCRWEVSVSKGKGMEWVHFNFPPPLLPTDATGPLLCWPIISNEVNEWKKYCFILNSTDCVINYCLLLTAITTKNIIHQIYIIAIPTINLHYKNRGWIPAYSGMLVPAS